MTSVAGGVGRQRILEVIEALRRGSDLGWTLKVTNRISLHSIRAVVVWHRVSPSASKSNNYLSTLKRDMRPESASSAVVQKKKRSA